MPTFGYEYVATIETALNIHSFDVRGRSFNKALHWSDPAAFGRRAYFVTMSRPSSLNVEAVQLDDEGIYRCRVDFKNSPTRNFQIRLNVVVPPHQLLLYDENGRDVAGVVGPLEEGGNFTLLCELRGGRPQPTLTWLINNRTVEDHTILKNDGKVIVIRPTSVYIVEKPVQVSADTEVTLVCISHGSRPPAQITWFRENRKYTRGKNTEFSNETSTISRLTMLPQPEDDAAVIRCRADNPILRVALEDSFRMTVVYRPVLTMSLGSTLNPNDIKEGDDVYFECNIRANPKEHRISWYHNDQQVTQNMSSGVFISTKSLVLQRVMRRDAGLYTCRAANQIGEASSQADQQVTQNMSSGVFISTKSLVLQRVMRRDAGLYTCRAANQIGEASSQAVYLRVQYAPVCEQPSPLLIGARFDESLRVRCTVSADPADVSFYWQFNNSGESFQVSPARYVSTGGTASELRYRAASERDYGSLLCRATNAVGRQKKPCVFQIVPAARPSPPKNCTAKRIIKNGEVYLTIQCTAGYDGGLSQHFTLEALGDAGKVLVNATAERNDIVVWLNISLLELDTLSEDETLAIFARNNKGSSDPVILRDMVYRDAAKQTVVITRPKLRWLDDIERDLKISPLRSGCKEHKVDQRGDIYLTRLRSTRGCSASDDDELKLRPLDNFR
ncbi:Nephrin [Papilio machaon]|uniref:Hemolin n=1 Tax=Papilio machaon TaxID=76193 RepID=A0A194RD42_PAPMA|nr:Nephrin [Papilio machaon]